ncbi:MAG: hypothetical protein V2I76_08090 [Roseobacter sp.]|jgi:hypothetical protein|nr:hypothetical protein [Roseobacter sp.]
MQIEQFKILRAARAIGEQGFTKPEIVSRADVGRAAVDSLFRRSGERFFEKTGQKRAGGEGRKSADIWRLRPEVGAEVDSLLDADRSSYGKVRVDPQAAQAALKDDHARWQARVSLYDAVDAGEGLIRQRHLNRCGKWIAHEERRHRHWGSASIIPEALKLEIQDLKRRRDAVECNIDRLAEQYPMRTIRDAFDWLRRGAVLFNEGNPEAFAPLRLSGQAAPHKVLAEAALLCSEFDGCARERFIIAMIAALPSLGASHARGLFCLTLDELGAEVGYALAEGIDRARPSDRPESLALVPAVLVGFQSFPELLKRTRFETVRRWYDNLPWSSDWNELWDPFWAELGPHTHKNANSVRKRLRSQADAPLQAGATAVDALRGAMGSAYDRVYSKLEQQIKHYYDPPKTVVGCNWLQSGAAGL